MVGLLFLVLVQFIWSSGQAQSVTGGGAYSYSDSTGNRYSGIYDLQPDGKVVYKSGNPAHFSDAAIPGYGYGFNPGYQGDDFYPTYFSNLENLLQELPPFHDFRRFRDEIPSFPRFPNFAMPNFPNGPNSAFASSSIGPGYRQQVAAINPQNPLSRNINVNRVSHYSDTPGNGGYYAVSSKSYASSSNVDGQEFNRRGAETTVDDNGKVTSYKVEN